jgi:predicted NUDIX family phosphoesterase
VVAERNSAVVLVFPRKILESIGEFQGYSLEIDKYLDVVLQPQNHFLISGEVAEKSPEFKQIISYVVLRFGPQVFTYLRGTGSHETRLIGRRSVGLGGHIETDVASPMGDRRSYRLAVQREIDEEVAINTPYVDKIVAVINDDSDDVGRVHFGILHIYTLAEPKVYARGQEIADGSFIELEELKTALHEFESWSQIALPVLAMS